MKREVRFASLVLSIIVLVLGIAFAGAAIAETSNLTPLDQWFNDLQVEKGMLRTWSLEDKATFSEQLAVMYAQELADYGRVSDYILPLIAHTYGLPGENDMDQNTALEIAQNAMTDHPIDNLVIYPFFYVDDPNDPVWAFQFCSGPERLYWVYVGGRPDDASIVVVDEQVILTPEEEALRLYDAMLEQTKGNIRYWTMEEKAEWSRLSIEAILSVDADYIPTVRYSLSAMDDLQEAAAITPRTKSRKQIYEERKRKHSLYDAVSSA